MKDNQKKLAAIPPNERILLLPHCLRRAENCKGKYSKAGLNCIGCNQDCPVNHLKKAAEQMGYKGVCVAPGGHLAVNYVKDVKPKAIVAVACDKELEEGIDRVRKLKLPGIKKPLITIIPLSKDGCVDTEVDEPKAIQIIETETD